MKILNESNRYGKRSKEPVLKISIDIYIHTYSYMYLSTDNDTFFPTDEDLLFINGYDKAFVSIDSTRQILSVESYSLVNNRISIDFYLPTDKKCLSIY